MIFHLVSSGMEFLEAFPIFWLHVGDEQNSLHQDSEGIIIHFLPGMVEVWNLSA